VSAIATMDWCHVGVTPNVLGAQIVVRVMLPWLVLSCEQCVAAGIRTLHCEMCCGNAGALNCLCIYRSSDVYG
jgi:hypothetical protein